MTSFNQTIARTEYKHHGYVIVHEYDVRGAEWGESFTIDGIDGEFNSLDDARDWIDEELDVDTEFDAAREWGLRSHQLV